MQDALLAEVARLGTRAYLAPGYDCGRWVADDLGRLKRIRNDELGREGFQTARASIESNDGAASGRVRGILVPREVETSSIEVLELTVRATGGDLKLPNGDARGLQRHRVLRGRQRAYEDADRAARPSRNAAPYAQHRARQLHLG